MFVCAGVKVGTKKQICDDTIIVNEIVINDDCFESEMTDIKVIGVADGVGGNAGGKEASSFIANRLSHMDFVGNIDKLKVQLASLNAALIEYASFTQERKQMATTLTAIISVESKYFLVHIGNTRMFVGQGSYLKQITQDHTTYQWLITHGQAEEAENCNKNEISACLGGGNQNLAKQIEIREVFENGLPNIIIFTSDGVHEYIDLDRFEELIFDENADKEIVDEIIREAEQNGSEDDKTIMIIRK